MATIYLIEGPVGAGKSTYATQLSREKSAACLNLDEWMVNLFSADRPAKDFMSWYNSRKQRCIEQIWLTSCELLKSEINVVLELGLVAATDRQSFYQRVDQSNAALQVIVIDAPREERLRRIRQRNTEMGETFRMVVSDEIFDIADHAWQPPDEQESQLRNIKWLATD